MARAMTNHKDIFLETSTDASLEKGSIASVDEALLLEHGQVNNGQISHRLALLAACFGAVHTSDREPALDHNDSC